MPGPKMGQRPADFDEELIRQSPTFVRWTNLQEGERIRYACREFIKGHNQDEERLMRRIMIARRNNLKDHQTLKRARQQQQQQQQHGEGSSRKARKRQTRQQPTVPLISSPQPPPAETASTHPESLPLPTTPTTATTITTAPSPRKRRPHTLLTDEEVIHEMDVPAVEATRSYRTWIELEDGADFCYNQKYVKGQDGHDWLLRKNIWRRMRYRRENKQMIRAPFPHPIFAQEACFDLHERALLLQPDQNLKLGIGFA